MVTKRTEKPPSPLGETFDCQLSACAYLLVKLLQHVEGMQEGALEHLRQTVDTDFSSIPDGAPDRDLAERTLQETLHILELASMPATVSKVR